MQPVSATANRVKGKHMGYFMCSIFLLMGTLFFYLFFLRPVIHIRQAARWPEVPCVIIASQVDSHRGNKGTTYSVNILYRYKMAGREYKANRYDFMGGSSSGSSGKQTIVNQHPPGSETVCYVNPADPTDAVLQRGFTNDMWFGLIPLLFMAVGIFGLVMTHRKNINRAV
jgi:Protein of unknown function (DUF3592)